MLEVQYSVLVPLMLYPAVSPLFQSARQDDNLNISETSNFSSKLAASDEHGGFTNHCLQSSLFDTKECRRGSAHLRQLKSQVQEPANAEPIIYSTLPGESFLFSYNNLMRDNLTRS